MTKIVAAIRLPLVVVALALLLASCGGGLPDVGGIIEDADPDAFEDLDPQEFNDEASASGSAVVIVGSDTYNFTEANYCNIVLEGPQQSVDAQFVVGGGNTFGTEDFIQVQAFTSEVDTYSRIDMGIGEFEWTLIDAPSPELAAGTAAWTDLEINRGERGTDGGAGAVDTVTITINC